MPFWKNLTTGKDNQTHDVVRFAIAVMTCMFPVLALWGMMMVTWAFAANRPFDLTATFEGFGVIVVSFGTYLAQGAGAIYMKRTTEPDGTIIDNTTITSGKQEGAKITEVQETVVNKEHIG